MNMCVAKKSSIIPLFKKKYKEKFYNIKLQIKFRTLENYIISIITCFKII